MPRKKDYSFTESRDANNRLKEVTFMPSTIETIDRALFNYINDNINASVMTKDGFTKVPVLWLSAERAFQIKDDKDLRDSKGVLKYPLMTVHRKSIVKDPNMKGVAWAHIPVTNDEKGGSITVARKINQFKTSNFANADSYRLRGTVGSPLGSRYGTGQLNSRGKNSKIVYNTVTMPMPTYVVANYTVLIRTEYQQQINEIMTPFIVRTGQINNFFMTHEGHKFEGFIQNEFGQSNNIEDLGEDERRYQTNIDIKVLGYLLGASSNDRRPKLTVRENAVEVKVPREHVIMDDDNNNTDESFYRS